MNCSNVFDTHRSVEFRVRKFLRILDGDSHIIVQLITGNCVSVKRIVGYVFRSPNHKASMYYSNVLHDMSRGCMIICEACDRCRKRLMLHYPNNRNLISMCNGISWNCWVIINILIRTLDTFDSRNRVVMTSVNGGVM